MRTIRLFLGAVLLLMLTPAGALTPTEVTKLLASDGAAGDFFGYSVALSGDTAVIGAYNGGSVYVFVRDAGGTWNQQAKLTASDGAAGDFFGASVALDGNTAVIGAHGDDDNGSGSGSAYVFVRDAAGTWNQQVKLTASDGAASDHFGHAVAFAGDTAVIGAYGDDDNGSGSGSAYVFVRDAGGTWTQQVKLLASDGAASDLFGDAVALDGNTAVIGAHGDDDNGSGSGSAYVFVRDAAGTWNQQAKLLASDGAAGDGFSFSVALDGDAAVIGTYGEVPSPYSAYVFVRDAAGNWSEQAKLLASDGAAEDWFGASVALDGDTVVIGAHGDDDIGAESGSAYVFSLANKLVLDIKPYEKRNTINPGSRGSIWVAVLSNNEFDPLQIDIPTVRFGPDEAEAIRYRVHDVDRDGIADLLLRFKTRETGIVCGDTEATLTGKTYGGQDVTGTDSIQTVGCKPQKPQKKRHRRHH